MTRMGVLGCGWMLGADGRRYVAWVVGVLGACMAAGCGGGAAPGGQSGFVRYDAQPLSEVQVTWHRAANGGFERVALGITRGDGGFRLVLPTGESAHLQAGRYRVALEHVGPPTWSLLPKLADPASSPLDIDVVGGEELTVNVPPKSVLVAQ